MTTLPRGLKAPQNQASQPWISKLSEGGGVNQKKEIVNTGKELNLSMDYDLTVILN